MSAINPMGATPTGGGASPAVKNLNDALFTLTNPKTYSPTGQDMQTALNDAKAVGGSLGDLCTDALTALQNTPTAPATGAAFAGTIYNVAHRVFQNDITSDAPHLMGTFVEGLGQAFGYLDHSKSQDDLTAFKGFMSSFNKNVDAGSDSYLASMLTMANNGTKDAPGLQQLIDTYQFGDYYPKDPNPNIPTFSQNLAALGLDIKNW